MQHATHLYAIAIGSNRPHGKYGRPAGVVEAAIARLDQENTTPMDALAYRFDVVLRGRRSTLFENRLEGN